MNGGISSKVIAPIRTWVQFCTDVRSRNFGSQIGRLNFVESVSFLSFQGPTDGAILHWYTSQSVILRGVAWMSGEKIREEGGPKKPSEFSGGFFG